VQRRPAETGAFAGAVGLLVAYIAGVDDPGVIVAIGVVVGGLPAFITTVVEAVRRRG